ncbi:MAG TPA: TIGR00341 family protein [Planctomycetes bacterium]|nr:TIGR00341 family protein [Planctomycetota bacterium]
MVNRLMQIVLPYGERTNLDTLLEGRKVLASWSDRQEDESLVVHLLLPAEETEPILDKLEQRYGGREGFHVLLMPVEAVLPRPEPEEKKEEKEEEVSEEEKAKAKKEEKEKKKKGIGIRVSREELYAELSEGCALNRGFVWMAILSAIVACVGLLRNDVAVLIGAMVIAPLLGPNVALALATTLGDMKLLKKALRTNLAGIGIGLSLALLMGVLLQVDPEGTAIRNRTLVSPGDLVLALSSGAAGAFALTSGMSSVLIGVMVAVALMPPLVTCGLLLASGSVGMAMGAAELTLANVICVNLAGVAVFLYQGVRPRLWWEAEIAKKATRRAASFWILLLLVLVGLLFFQ